MAYTENENPGGLDVLTALATSDLVIVGDVSDSNRAKAITFANLEAGLTLANQIGYNTLAPKDAPTFSTSITGSYLTASELLATNGSKGIVSLAVATYPSLTELTYVKGVTSAIQTQINTKAPTASPTFTGTLTVPTVKITGGSPGVGKVLTSDADGDATWETPGGGGAWVVIGTNTPTSGTSSTFSGISTSYKYFRLLITVVSTGTMDDIFIQINGDTTASNYGGNYWIGNNAGFTRTTYTSSANGLRMGGSGSFGAPVLCTVDIQNTLSTNRVSMIGRSGGMGNNNDDELFFGNGGWDQTADITSLTINITGVSFASGSRITLLGTTG